MPDESTILRFRHRLEKHKLAEQILATVNDPARVKVVVALVMQPTAEYL